MRRALTAAMFAMGYAVFSATPMLVVGAAPFVLTGCDQDSDLEDAAEDAGDKIEDTADDVEDKLD
jgi:hypothetical protein